MAIDRDRAAKKQRLTGQENAMMDHIIGNVLDSEDEESQSEPELPQHRNKISSSNLFAFNGES